MSSLGSRAAPAFDRSGSDARLPFVGVSASGRLGYGIGVAVIVTLGLFVAVGYGTGLLIGAIVAACLVPLWIMVLGRRRYGASGLVYGYLLVGLLGGVFAADSLIPGETQRLGVVVTGYGAFLLGLWIVVGRRSDAPAAASSAVAVLQTHAEKRLLWALAASLAVGALGWFMVVGSSFNLGAFVNDPQSARETLSASGGLNTYAVTAFRMLIVSGLLGFALLSFTSRRSMKWLGGGTIAASAVLLFTYGGRLLPSMLLLAIIVFRHIAVRPLNWRRVLPLLIAGIFVATWYAGYRYYAFFGDSFTFDKFGTTLARQLGGDVVDATRVSVFFGLGDGQARDTLLQQMRSSTLPGFLKGPLQFQEYRSFGQFASGAVGQSKVGGIRVGVSGEAVLAFGVLGAAVVGALLGGVLRMSDALTSARRVWPRALGAVAVSMIVFVVITGAANLLSALTAVAGGALFLRFGLAGADAEPPAHADSPSTTSEPG